MPAKKTKDKKLQALVSAMKSLVMGAKAVNSRHGFHDDNTPKDWSEWIYLRQFIHDAELALRPYEEKREPVKGAREE